MSTAPDLDTTPAKVELEVVKDQASEKLLREHYLSFRNEGKLAEAVGSIAASYMTYRSEAIEADMKAKTQLSKQKLKEYQEFDRGPAAKRRDLAVRIFSELGMLDKAMEQPLAASYERAESDLEIDLTAAKETVIAYFEHPALRVARQLENEKGLQYSRDDAIITQRAVAQLLEQAGFAQVPMQE